MTMPMIRRGVFLLLTIVLAAGPVSAVDTMAQAARPSSQATTPRPSGSGQAPTGPAVALSMQQAVDLALEANLGLKADRIAPAISAQDVARAKSLFVPTVSSGVQRNTRDQIPSSFFESSSSVVSSSSLGVSAGVSQLLPWYGGSYNLSWSGGRSETNATSTFNPQTSSTFNVNLTQPLLRNFKTDSARTSLQTTARQQQITDTNLLEQIAQTERSTRLAYLSLIVAIQNRGVAQQNLDVANASLRNTRARVDVGVTAPADIVDADASVAANEEALIVAESSIESRMDQLRQLIFDPTRADYWSVRINPTDTVGVEARTINVDEAVKKALDQRTDLINARKTLEIQNINIDLLHNTTLPAVDLKLSYSGSGLAGTQNVYASTFPPVILSQTSRGFGGALGDSFNNSYPSWTYGLQVSYPIGKSDTEASLTRAQLQKQQGQLQLRDLELQVATQVRDAARQVETNFKRVQASRASLQAQEKRLEAEQKRFDVGTSDTFKLFQVQRDVAAARVSELQSMLAYSQALINFDAVQRIR